MRKISNNNSWVGAPTDLFTPLGRFYSQSSVHLTLNLQGCSYGNSALEYMVNFGYSGTPRVYFMGPSSYGTAPLGLDSEVNFYYETINTTSYYLGFTVSGGCNDSSRTVATIASVNGDVAFDSKDAVQSNYTLLNTYRYLYNGYEGNVGIGTIAPGYKLTVNGGTGDVLNVAGGQINGLNSTPTSADQAVPLGYLQSNYSTAAASAASTLWNGTLNGNIYNGTAGTGNVGIGTTNPIVNLQLGNPDASGSDVPSSGNWFVSSGGYIYTYDQAAAYCASQGARLAYFSEMLEAFKNGANSCSWGWVYDKFAVYPMQDGAVSGCGGPVGGLRTSFASLTTTYSAYCARDKQVSNGSISVGGSIKTRGVLLSASQSIGEMYLGAISSGTNVDRFGLTGTGNITFENIGNVGIGTIAPGTKLTVSAGTGNAVDVSGGRIVGLNTTPVNANEAVPLTYLQANYSTAAASAASTLWNGTLNGNIYNGTTGAGNVGIGTTNPTQKLTVRGKVQFDSSNTYTTYSWAGGTLQTNSIEILDKTGGSTSDGIYPTLTFHDYGHGGAQFTMEGSTDILHLASGASNSAGTMQTGSTYFSKLKIWGALDT